jgi:eukaryotic-like serine/threonine-protein kinase
MTSAQVPGSSAQRLPQSQPGVQDYPNLRQFLDAQRAQGERVRLMDAVELLVPLCVELAEIHRQGYGVHVHPANLVFNPRGGLSLSTELAAQAPQAPADRACLPPESQPGELGPASASVYAVGAVLYEMVTGLSAGHGMRRPSEVVPGLPSAAETLIAKALIADPARRPSDLNALAQALYAFAPQPTIPPPPAADLTHLDQIGDFQVDISLSMLPPASLADQQAASEMRLPSAEVPGLPGAYAHTAGPNSSPRSGPQSGPHSSPGPASPQSTNGSSPNSSPHSSARGRAAVALGPNSGPRSGGNPNSQPRGDAATAELSALKARLEGDPSPVYVVVKDGMDHGPFNAVELLQQIASHTFVQEHVLRHNTSKEERPIGEWDDFKPFAEHARLHRDIAEEKAAIDRGVAQDSKRTRSKAFIGLLLLGVLLLGAGSWFLTQVGTRSDQVAIHTETVSNIEAEGDLKVKGGPGGGGGKRVVGSQGGIPQLAGGMSCEAAQAAYVEEMKMSGGGQADITRGQYASIMNSGAYFSHCGVPSNVAVSICAAVQSGRAVGVSVSTTPSHGSRACIASAVRGLRFPSHPKLDVVRSSFAAE